MQSYPLQGNVKIFVEPHEKPLDVRKTTNIEIGNDRREALYHQTFCPTILGKLFPLRANN